MSHDLTSRVKRAALDLGFDRVAIARVQSLAAAPRLREWLERRMHGSMTWLERGADRRADPGRVVPGARSVVVVARNYWTGLPIAEDPTLGRVSRYAWGAEYHEILGAGVEALYERIREEAPGASGRYYVDTGPVMEKAWAEVAGLGWIGKHTNLISVGVGSWFFLGAILLDVELEPGDPARDHCGSCTACIDVCPTRAIVAPYVLDARRCIAYLTIENRGPIPRDLRPLIGNRIFGCDDCQEVCPWNRFATVSASSRAFLPRPGVGDGELVRLLSMDREEFAERYRGTPVKRARWVGLLRNVAVALGNSGDVAALPSLLTALDHEEALVRGHAAWAVGRLGSSTEAFPLRHALREEADAWVREELQLALEAVGGTIVEAGSGAAGSPG